MSEEISSELQSKVIAAAALLSKGLSDYDGSIVFANSLGAEDVVIADLISKHCPDIKTSYLIPAAYPKKHLSYWPTCRGITATFRLMCTTLKQRMLKALLLKMALMLFMNLKIYAKAAVLSVKSNR